MRSIISLQTFLIAAITFLQVMSFPAAAIADSFKTSFDCTKARTRVELAICGHQQLADADGEMAMLYKSLLTSIPDNEKGQLKHEQRDWLKNRSLCESSNIIIDCLKDVYDKRIGALKGRKEALSKPEFIDKTTLSGNIAIPFTIQKGELRVFGHVLTSSEISANDDEYHVSFRESPNKRWVVIGYDEPFEKTLVWLYDRNSKAAPVPVMAKRVGKHFGVDWYGNSIFAVYFGGMGYKTSQLFSVATPETYAQVESVIDYDPVRDIYARFEFDKDFISYVIVGRAFHAKTVEEKFPVKLETDDLVDAMALIKNVTFGRADVIIRYESEKGIITNKHESIIVENAK